MVTDPALEFTCARCGETFTKGWSDEEAAAESAANFGELAADDQAVICDGCYREFMRWWATVDGMTESPQAPEVPAEPVPSTTEVPVEVPAKEETTVEVAPDAAAP